MCRQRYVQATLTSSSDPGSGVDRYWMQYCLQLARQAEGWTSPNPMVGAAVVREGTLLGSGYHPGAGQPHAEVFALEAAGAAAEGSTLYVTLEPCNHYGRTPPCTDAILKAGIRRVVAGMVDPNPKVAGQGLARLRAAGVEVMVGVEEAACQRLNEAFCFGIVHRRCFGILKYAMTLDGRIATSTGQSRWISGPESRQRVHQLRSQVDAVVVGSGTVKYDDPQLTCRLSCPHAHKDSHSWPPHQPLRVILSRHLDLPRTAQVWDTQVARTLVFTGSEFDGEMEQFLTQRGVAVDALAELTPFTVAERLFERGCLSALWECGETLAAAALETGAIQKILAFVAPKVIGGATAPGPIGGAGVDHMSAALVLEHVRYETIGSDMLIEGYRPAGWGSTQLE